MPLQFDGRDATSSLITRGYFDVRLEALESRIDARFSEHRADFSRALLILAGFIVAVAGASLAASQLLG